MDSLSSLSNFVKDMNNTKTSKSIVNFMDHKMIKTTLYFFLILYAWLVVPALPKSAAKIFNNPFFRLLVFFIIAYYGSNGDVTVSILFAICFVLSLIALNKNDTEDSLSNLLHIYKKRLDVKSTTKNSKDTNKDESKVQIPKVQVPEYNVTGNILDDKYNMIEGFNNDLIESFDGPEFALY
jgi:hypothetical protein